jgi:hypothetical protein
MASEPPAARLERKPVSARAFIARAALVALVFFAIARSQPVTPPSPARAEDAGGWERRAAEVFCVDCGTRLGSAVSLRQHLRALHGRSQREAKLLAELALYAKVSRGRP